MCYIRTDTLRAYPTWQTVKGSQLNYTTRVRRLRDQSRVSIASILSRSAHRPFAAVVRYRRVGHYTEATASTQEERAVCLATIYVQRCESGWEWFDTSASMESTPWGTEMAGCMVDEFAHEG